MSPQLERISTAARAAWSPSIAPMRGLCEVLGLDIVRGIARSAQSRRDHVPASPHVSSRSRSLMTVAAYHLPPVALAILRRFSSAAALCADKPASWAITGRIRSARAAASLALRSDPAVQPPSFAPRRLAAARPALVRCEMSARSFCASAANRWRTKGSTSAPRLGDDERHGVNHQARNEMHSPESRSSLDTITGPPRPAALIAAASCGPKRRMADGGSVVSPVPRDDRSRGARSVEGSHCHEKASKVECTYLAE